MRYMHIFYIQRYMNIQIFMYTYIYIKYEPFFFSSVYTIFFLIRHINIWLQRKEICLIQERERSRMNTLLNNFSLVTTSAPFLVPGQELSLEMNSTPHYYYLNFLFPICTLVYFVFIAYRLFKDDTHKIQCGFLKIVVIFECARP